MAEFLKNYLPDGPVYEALAYLVAALVHCVLLLNVVAVGALIFIPIPQNWAAAGFANKARHMTTIKSSDFIFPLRIGPRRTPI